MTISNLTKMAENYQNILKTRWEKEKLLVTSNFSFSHIVFKRPVSQGRQKVSLCGNGLTLYHTIPTFNDFETGRLLKTLWEKEKMMVTSIFSFSHNVFYPSQNKLQFLSHIYFIVCKNFQLGPV